jgi:hypothetical protein
MRMVCQDTNLLPFKVVLRILDVLAAALDPEGTVQFDKGRRRLLS